MSIDRISQKRNLFQKMSGLGKPQPPQSPQPPSSKPSPPPSKPGCGSCRRKPQK
jgi:hypothetical protein